MPAHVRTLQPDIAEIPFDWLLAEVIGKPGPYELPLNASYNVMRITSGFSGIAIANFTSFIGNSSG
jgi:hypothetical protein